MAPGSASSSTTYAAARAEAEAATAGALDDAQKMTTAKTAAAKALRVLAYGALLVLVAGALALATAGFWLVPATAPLRQADAIVVLAGGYERSLYAADLYAQGLAPKVRVSVPAREHGAHALEQYGIELPREEDIHRRILQFRKVPASDISFFGNGSLSTAEEATALRQATDPAACRLIIVTSPAHTRRARLVYADAFAAQDYDLQIVATPYEQFDPYWWNDQGSARSVILEMAKLLYYQFGGRFLSRSGGN